MTVLERLARLMDRVFDRLRDRRAFTLTEHDAVDADLGSLRGQKYAVLVTFRRTGEAVPSPVWIGLDASGRAYVKTADHTGKVKRLGNDPRVLIAPSNARGRPTGPAVRGQGRVVPRDEWPRAEEALRAANGVGRSLSERVLGGPEERAVYLEITAGR